MGKEVIEATMRLIKAPMKDMLKLLFWFLLGITVGLPVGMEIAGGTDMSAMLHNTAVAVSLTGILCLIAVIILQKKVAKKA